MQNATQNNLIVPKGVSNKKTKFLSPSGRKIKTIKIYFTKQPVERKDNNKTVMEN